MASYGAMRITGERVVTPEGGFNPTWQRHVAAYALAEPELGPGRCSTWAAASATRSTCSPPGRPSASTSTPRRSPASTARRWSPTCARCPSRTASFASVLSVHSIEHVPDRRAGARRGRAGARAGRHRGVRDPEPADARAARRDHRPVPLRRVRPGRATRPVRARASTRSPSAASSAPPATWRSSTRSARTLDRLLGLDPLRAPPARPDARQAAALRRDAAPLPPRRRPARAGDRPEDFELRDDDLGAALDVVAICSAPRRRMRPDCAWCGAPLDGGAVRLRGRARCPALRRGDHRPVADRRGARRAPTATGTGPAPGSASVARRRAAAPQRGMLAGRLDAIAPPGPMLDVGAGDGTLLDALHARGREAIGLERDSRGPTSGRHAAGRPRRPAGRRSSSGTRSSTCPSRATPSRAGRAAAAPGGVLVVAVPDTASLQARAFGDRWLHLDPPAPPRPPDRATALAAGLEAKGCASSGLARPRRPDRHRLARRPRRARCPATSTSTRRCAGPRPARSRSPRAGASPRWPPASRCSPVALPARRPPRSRCAAREPSTLRPALAERIRPAKVDRRHARPPGGARRSRRPSRRSPGRGRRGDPRRRLLDRRDRQASPGELPIHVVWHPHQVGYGGNQKTCYLEALQHDADVVVMLHPDGQYEPELIPSMIEPIVARRGRPGARLAPARSRAPRSRPACRAGSSSPTAS